MYRRAAAHGPLHGVEAGAYTGGKRVVDAGKLPRATKQRLVDVLRGRGEPSLIVYDRPSALGSSVRSVWGAVLGVVVLVTTFAVGLDHEGHAWEVQPRIALGVYALACVLFAFSLLAVLRRRFLVGGSELRPGRYLLPLDVVEVAPVDTLGRQLITITPLGDARDAKVRGEGWRAELVLTFHDTSQVVFPLRSDPGGRVTIRRLEHAQRLLEELTYENGLDKRLANDPFFELRVDGSWSSAEPTAEGGPTSLRTRRSLSTGRGGPALAATTSLVFAMATFGARNWIGTHLVIAREQARAEQERIAQAKARADREAAQRREEEEASRTAAGSAAHDAASCVATLERNASHKHPEVLKTLEDMLEAGTAIVPVGFDITEIDPPDGRAEDFSSREHTFVRTFERVFSEMCPASVLEFQLRSDMKPVLRIRYKVTWSKPWSLEKRGGGTISVPRMNVVFNVSFGSESFVLTLPPPEHPSMQLRAKSIFVSDVVDDGTFDERVYGAMSARAFDRLYDEVWSLFFEGDPRVPLRKDPHADGF